MAINAYSVQLITTLLEDSATVITSPGQAETGAVLEAYGGFPARIAAGASGVNIKLGTMTDPKWFALFGAEGVSFTISDGGDAIAASPFAFLADVEDGLGISEIWVSNSDSQEHTITMMGAE